MTPIQDLERALGAVLRRPGEDGYVEATHPRNSTASQHPVAVVAAATADDVARALRVAGDVGLAVAVQATGHGAAGVLGQDVLLIDTSGLTTVSIDATACTARVGAGVTWASLNATAEPHGLLGLAGTAPDVGVVGYTVLGGVGWLTRPFGLASASLRRVEFVDGEGQAHVADAETNREAWWAFRGGAGTGVVTSVEIDLVSVPELWAGYQLWPIDEAEPVVRAWAGVVPTMDPHVTSAIGFLTAPDAPTVPEPLRGHRVVHLAAASTLGAGGFAPLREVMREAPRPAIDTIDACDVRRLSAIHLDPPSPVPALGEGRWLTADAAGHALDILGAHGLGDSAPLTEIEIRHVATSARADATGALTSPPGPFLIHAVGAAPDDHAGEDVQQALDTVRAATGPVDAGRAAISFLDGQTGTTDAFSRQTRDRLKAARRLFDPQQRLRLHRVV